MWEVRTIADCLQGALDVQRMDFPRNLFDPIELQKEIRVLRAFSAHDANTLESGKALDSERVVQIARLADANVEYVQNYVDIYLESHPKRLAAFMNLELNVGIWMRACKPSFFALPKRPFFRGNTFYHHTGFSRDDEYGYDGKALLLNPACSVVENKISISEVRYGGLGYGYHLDGAANPPAPPFLLTDRVDMRVIYHGKVQIDPLKRAKKVFDHNSDGGEFSICERDWIGILHHYGASRGPELTAFSYALSRLPGVVHPFFAEGHDCIGKISLV